MALFGDDMVEVTTPDGRRMTVPAQLAAQFPGLQQDAPPPGPPPIGPPIAMPPPIPSAPQLPPPTDAPPPGQPQLPPPAPAGGPIMNPNDAPMGDAPRPRGPVTSPGEIVEGTGAPGPMTNDQLAKMGNAGVYNAEQGAIGEQRTAVKRQGEALANQATAVGNQMAAEEVDAARILQEQKVFAEENTRAIQAKTDEYLRNAKAIADTKIDRNADHPILAAIGVALGGIGAAMSGHGESNPALDAFYKAIDRKVAGQIQDLDKRRAGLSDQREAIGMQRQAGQDRLAELTTYRLAAIEGAKRRIEKVKQTTTSDVTRAGTDMLLADLSQKSVAELAAAQAREQQKRDAEAARKQAAQQHAQTIGVQIRGQNLQNQQHKDQLAERAQERLDAIAAQLMARGDKASADLAKRVGEEAVTDPATGDPLLTPDGKAKLEQADALEATARKDPTAAAKQYIASQRQSATDAAGKAKLDAIEARASVDPPFAAQVAKQGTIALRQVAQQNDIALTGDKEKAKLAQHVVNIAQDTANNVDAATRMLKGDSSAWSREEWAKITVALEGVKTNYAQAMGERMSPKALEAVEHILSIDADSLTSRSIDVGKALAALKVIDQQIGSRADVQLRGAGIKSGWTPTRRPNQVTIEGKTAGEAADGATPGWVGKYVTGPFVTAFSHPGESPDETVARKQSEAYESAASGSQYGLAPDDESNAIALVKRANGVSNAERGRIIDTLAQPLLSNRPSLVSGVANLLRDQDRQVYAAVVSRVLASNPSRAKEIVAFDNLKQADRPASLDQPTKPYAPDEEASINAQRSSTAAAKKKADEDERKRFRDRKGE